MDWRGHHRAPRKRERTLRESPVRFCRLSGTLSCVSGVCLPSGKLDCGLAGQVPEQDRTLGTMEFTASPKPQLSSRANAFSIAALMSSGGPKEKEAAENTIKPLGKSGARLSVGARLICFVGAGGLLRGKQRWLFPPAGSTAKSQSMDQISAREQDWFFLLLPSFLWGLHWATKGRENPACVCIRFPQFPGIPTSSR